MRPGNQETTRFVLAAQCSALRDKNEAEAEIANTDKSVSRVLKSTDRWIGGCWIHAVPTVHLSPSAGAFNHFWPHNIVNSPFHFKRNVYKICVSGLCERLAVSVLIAFLSLWICIFFQSNRSQMWWSNSGEIGLQQKQGKGQDEALFSESLWGQYPFAFSHRRLSFFISCQDPDNPPSHMTCSWHPAGKVHVNDLFACSFICGLDSAVPTCKLAPN